MRRLLAILTVLAGFAAAPGAASAAGVPAPAVANADRAPAGPEAVHLPRIGYTALIQAAAHGRLRAAAIDVDNGRAVVTLRDGASRYADTGYDATLAQLLARDGVPVTFAVIGQDAAGAGHGSGSGVRTLVGILVLVLLVGAGIGFTHWMARRAGRTRRQRREEAVRQASAEQSTVRFADVAGCDEAVEELQDTLDFLRAPERFRKVGAQMPSGVILYGPPGTGKTLLAKAVAGEAGVPFYTMSGSDFVEMYVGVGAKRVRELFAKAKRSERGAVIFIDEIDAIGRRRSATSASGGSQESENTLNALLVELDGFAGRPGLICIAATNRVDMLDEALLRPGRFGLQIQVETPDEKGRRAILDLYARQKPLAEDVDLDALAAYTAGSSGAQLADMLNQGAIMAARAGREEITDADLREGHLRVLAGPERQNAQMRPEERRLVAWHEAGHALAAELQATQDKAQRVTIRPRGRAAGLAVYGQTDRALHSRQFFHERLVCVLAGRAAEQLLVGEISSGAANDLQQANMLARQAVTELGFSERVGQLIAHEGRHQLADETRRVADEEVERVVADAYRDALTILAAHRGLLDALAEALLERGQLERVDILLALGGQPEPVSMDGRRRPLQAVPSEPAGQPQPVRRRRAEGGLAAVARWLEDRPALRRARASRAGS
jgi:cell division protease FtsH